MGIENPIEINRNKVDVFKKVIKDKNIFNLDEENKKLAAKEVIGELGIKGVDTIEDLFNKTQNENVNKEIARNNIKDLGTAIAESILESDKEELKEAMIAGSYSVEALLPEAWRGRTEGDLGDVGLGGVICDSLYEKISNKDKRENIQVVMETVDFLKNNDEYKNMLEAQIDSGMIELRKLINPLNKNEMVVILERLKYLEDLKQSSLEMVTETSKIGRSKREKYIRRPTGKAPGEEGPDIEEERYDMSRATFNAMERANKAIRWYSERPPEFYEKLNKTQKEIFDIRIKLNNASASKEYLRNRDVEKLRGNVPEITGKEFYLLMKELPGFKEALTFIVKELCEKYTDEDQRVLLRFKNQEKSEGKLDTNTLRRLENFDSFRSEAENYLLNKKIQGIKSNGEIEAVSTAINFLYLGDSFESWDYFRELKPTKIISDKLRTIDHPMIKALGKWKVWKTGSMQKSNIDTDLEAEPFIEGPLSDWILNRINIEGDNFKKRLIEGDLKNILPKTLCVSMLEATKIGDTNLAMALYEEDKGIDWIIKQMEADDMKMADDKNIMQSHNDMVQGADYLLNLLRGKIQYSKGKNESQFVSAFIENTSLVRQEPFIPLKTEKESKKTVLVPLKAVDKPEFVAWSLLIACGFNPKDKNPMIKYSPLGAVSADYDLRVKELVDKITVRSSANKKEIYDILGVSNYFMTMMRRSQNEKEKNKERRFF